MWPLLTFLPPAGAHVGDVVGGIDIVPPPHGEDRVDVEATYGLVLQRDDGGWDWVCHEAVTAPGAVRAPRYARSTGGVWLASVSDFSQGRDGRTLFRSADGGCTWDDVAGIDGRLVTAATFDPSDPLRAWAVTGEPGGAASILASTDGGASWAVDTDTPGRHFHALAFGQGAAFATATDLGGTRGYLWHRPDGGAWTEREVPLPAGVEGARLTLVEAVGAERAWVVVDPLGDDTLLETTDAGATWTEVMAAQGEIVDAAADATGLWVAVGGIDLVRIEGGEVSPPAADFPLSIGIETVGDALLAAPQSYIVGPLLSRSAASGPFETLSYPDDVVGPLACPAGSQVAERCAPLWDVLLPDLRGFDAPAIETAEDTGRPRPDPREPGEDRQRAAKACGCGSGSAAAAPLLGGLLLGLRRRR